MPGMRDVFDSKPIVTSVPSGMPLRLALLPEPTF